MSPREDLLEGYPRLERILRVLSSGKSLLSAVVEEVGEARRGEHSDVFWSNDVGIKVYVLSTIDI